MKKYLSVVLISVLIAITFSACQQVVYSIEACSWEMGAVLSLEENGKTIADKSSIDLSLTAENGELILEDKTNNEVYKGAYEEMIVTDEINDYKIYLDGKEGYALISETEYENKESEITLVISVDGYDMYFYEK